MPRSKSTIWHSARSLRPMVLALTLLHASGVAAQSKAAPSATSQADVMTETLAGEFDLQNGRLKDAAKHYLAAATRTGDAALAERATRIALLADDNDTARQALDLWRPQAPRALVVRMADLTLKLRAGDIVGATTQARDLIADPDPRGWRVVLVALSSGGKDTKVPATVLGALVDAKALPDDVQAWLAYAGLAQRLAQPQLAKAIVAETAKRYSADPRVALLQASQLVDEGRFDEARAVAAKLEPQAAGNPALRFTLAGQYEQLGDYSAAERVLSRGEQSIEVIGLRAAMLDKAKDNAGLLRLYEQAKAEANKPDPRNRLLIGSIAETLKKHDEALEWYRGVPGGDQGDSARLRIANVLYEKGSKADAYKALAALQSDPSVNDAVQRDAFLLEGELRRKDKDDAKELAAYDRGLGAMQDEQAILYARALAWERMDRVDKAEADLRRILVTDPENTAALNALGYTLADRTTRYAEALQLIDRARAADPSNGAIVDSYGWVLYKLGRHEEALTYLQRAFVLQKDAEIAAHIGEVLWVKGRRDEARKWFEEARKIDPESKPLKRALDQLGVK